MSEADDLLRELRTRLSLNSVSYTSASAANDVYEAFVFAIAVDTAAARGATVYYEDVYGRRTRDLVFRTSPGRLHSTRQTYTHAVVEFDGTPALEIHVGVYVEGNSRVLHECDVLILEKSEADGCRRFGVMPRCRRCLLAVECKYYVSNLPLGQARGFVGLNADLGQNKALFVANTSSDNVVRYLDHRKAGWEHLVLPHSSQAENLSSEIRKVFRHHVSRHNSRLRI